MGKVESDQCSVASACSENHRTSAYIRIIEILDGTPSTLLNRPPHETFDHSVSLWLRAGMNLIERELLRKTAPPQCSSGSAALQRNWLNANGQSREHSKNSHLLMTQLRIWLLWVFQTGCPWSNSPFWRKDGRGLGRERPSKKPSCSLWDAAPSLG